MTAKLEPRWVSFLVDQPESGMGYQVVDVRLRDDRLVEKVMVFNCEEIQLPEEFVKVGIKELRLHRE
jgi:hypothetical protein